MIEVNHCCSLRHPPNLPFGIGLDQHGPVCHHADLYMYLCGISYPVRKVCVYIYIYMRVEISVLKEFVPTSRIVVMFDMDMLEL